MRVEALGALEAQAGPLPARQQHGRDAALAQHRLARLPRPRLAPAVGVGARQGDQRVGRRRGDLAVDRRRLARHQVAHEPADEPQVEVGELGLQRRPLLAVQGRERVGQPLLPRRAERVLGGHAGVRATLVTPSARAAISLYPSAASVRGRRWLSIGAGSSVPACTSSRSSGM